MRLWDKIRIDYEFLKFDFNQLEEKYDIEAERIELKSQLESWERKFKDSHWPELFRDNQNISTRIEMLEYMLHESTFQKAYELEHEIYDKLIEIERSVNVEYGLNPLAEMKEVILHYKSLRELRLKVIEVFHGISNRSEVNMETDRKSSYLEEILEEVENARELEVLRSIVKRIEEKRSFESDRSKISGDITTQIH